MQPVLTQVPPNSLRSTSATFMPARGQPAGEGGPACPAPMMMASKLCSMARIPMSALERIAVPCSPAGELVRSESFLCGEASRSLSPSLPQHTGTELSRASGSGSASLKLSRHYT